MESTEVTLLVPGLLTRPLPGDAAAQVAGLDLADLERLLARADPLPAPAADGAERVLYGLFHAPADPAADPPVAAVTWVADTGKDAHGWWLRADPVHLRADVNALHLLDASHLDISAAEAAALAGELQVLLDPPARLLAPVPRRWYLRLPAPAAVRTVAPGAAAGRALRERLPNGPDAALWHRLMNEAQMLLHASPVNAAREARGQPPVNSLWLWGGGSLPTVPAGTWQGVWADDPFARGLAHLGGVPLDGLPVDPATWLAGLPPGRHLAVLETLAVPARTGDLEGWREALAALVRDWIGPLLRALQRRRLTAVTLVTESGRTLRLDRGGLRRFWRRPRSLAACLA